MVCRVASAGRQTERSVARSRPARWRPNWWVILAVSLALIALLVETSGRDDGGPALHVQSVASTHGPLTHRLTRARGVRSGRRPRRRRPRRRRPVAPPATTPVADRSPAFDCHDGTDSTVVPPASTTTTTTTPSPPMTTSTSAAPAALAADHSQTEGYFDPPLQTSGQYEVNGSGPTEVSVLWSAPVYLTMTRDVSGRQSDRRRHDGHGGIRARCQCRLPGHGQRAVHRVHLADLLRHVRTGRWLSAAGPPADTGRRRRRRARHRRPGLHRGAGGAAFRRGQPAAGRRRTRLVSPEPRRTVRADGGCVGRLGRLLCPITPVRDGPGASGRGRDATGIAGGLARPAHRHGRARRDLRGCAGRSVVGFWSGPTTSTRSRADRRARGDRRSAHAATLCSHRLHGAPRRHSLERCRCTPR